MISVIIPTYNAMDNIERLLSALKAQQLEQNCVELFVIDSSSQDGTAEYCRACPDVRCIQIDKKDFNHGRTRNLAASQSHGDILIFMTQDALPADHYFLANLIRPITEKKASASFGRQVAKPDATPKEILTRLYNYPETDTVKGREDVNKLGIKTFFFTNVCSAVDRHVFEEAGGFPDRVILNEDMMLAYKLIQSGHKIAYTARARVLHSHDYTCMQQFRRNFDIAVSLKMHGEILQYTHTEVEGKRYVTRVCKSLMQQKEFGEVLDFIAQAAFKFAGYRLGMHYREIPLFLKRKFSMNPGFWY